MLNSINKKMSRIPIPVQERPLSVENKKKILNNFVIVSSPRNQTPQFCVDGRMGNRFDSQNNQLTGPYVQSLGGSLHPVILNWILKEPENSYSAVSDKTLLQLIEKDYRIGMHTDSHSDGQEKSGCGLADNLESIINRLKTDSKDIWHLLIKTDPSLASEESIYQKIMGQLAKLNLETIPSGHRNVFDNYDDLQELEGDHEEIAAIVNTKQGTTLDVDNNQDTQAFNLDLWWVLEQAKELGIDQTEAKLLSLGLYVATEMILVEDKRGVRLPIVVNS
jgi:hypothetical protein